MKVLHLEAGRHLYGGARQVLYLIGGLASRGVESVLACPARSTVAGEARRQGFRVAELAMGGDADLSLTFRLTAAIRREQPDLVHLHSRRGADLWGAMAARLTGTPCVLSRRVDNPEPRWLARLKYRLYDRVVCISEAVQQVLLAEGVPAERLALVHSAVRAEAFEQPCDADWLRRKLSIPGQGLLVGVVAQLIPRKGHRMLLEALPPVLQRHPDLSVLLFGKGALEGEIAAEVERRGLGDNVRLVGFRDDLERILGCLDLVVHPALMEGLGVALLQAAAAGVPIIGARAGGVPEVVHDGENGLLVPPGDANRLSSAMLRLVGDPGLRRRMGEAGRTMVRQSFSVEAMVEGNLAVYRSVL